MKIVVQRVLSASVVIDEKQYSSIKTGLLLLVGIHKDDTSLAIHYLAEKCVQLRIFNDENGKMNKSVGDVDGEIMAVSQFTLFGDCTHGRRPSFIEAADPVKGKALYDGFVDELIRIGAQVKTGVFGADMKVGMVNDGPVTLILDR